MANVLEFLFIDHWLKSYILVSLINTCRGLPNLNIKMRTIRQHLRYTYSRMLHTTERYYFNTE